MKIAITADPYLPVPPSHYGGIERVVHLLVAGLVERGHDVTLFAHADSRVSCRLVGYPRARPGTAPAAVRCARRVVGHIAAARFDLVHSFGRLAYVACLLPAGPPILMTYQRPITRRSVRLARLLSRGRLELSAVGRHMIAGLEDLASWHVVPNAVADGVFDFRDSCDADAPLVFLGRVEHIKGAHLAIDVARRAGRRLVIAGNVPDEAGHRRYFDERIAPNIDGQCVTYVGAVDDRAKNELLGRAAGLLMPVLWDEPFGIVMAEALACGTPVIGLDRGAIAEVVEHGVTGFVCASTAEMADAVSRLARIERAACRDAMQRRFSAGVVVDAYEAIYRRMLSAPRAALAPAREG